MIKKEINYAHKIRTNYVHKKDIFFDILEMTSIFEIIDHLICLLKGIFVVLNML